MDKIIFVFGTSTALGFLDSEGGGWADRLKRFCMQRIRSIKDDYVTVYNLGIDGDTTTGVLRRLESEIKPRLWPKNKIVIIFNVGGNDAMLIQDRKPKVSISQFEKNILSLIRIAKKFSHTIIFLGLKPSDESRTAPIPWNSRIFYRNERIKMYNDIIKRVAAEKSAFFIETWDIFAKNSGRYLAFDGLHLNESGHKKIFEIVRDFLGEHKLI